MRVELLKNPAPADRAALLAVWESSVRATHDFLDEADIAALRREVPEYFDALRLWVARNGRGAVIAFAGIAGDMLEMLFVRADARGKGYGKALMRRALDEGVTRVDVNEQNPLALSFYEHTGFAVYARSALDGQGRPFPLLHMRLQAAGPDNPVPLCGAP